MSDFFDELKLLVPPPQLERVRPVPDDAWTRLESVAGVAVPTDIRQLLDAYGDTLIAGFIRLKSPADPNSRANSADLHLRELSYLRDVWEDSIFPRPKWSDDFRFILWAITENANALFWSPDIVNGSVVVNGGRSVDVYIAQMSAVEFLVRSIRGDVRVQIFPDDWPDLMHD